MKEYCEKIIEKNEEASERASGVKRNQAQSWHESSELSIAYGESRIVIINKLGAVNRCQSIVMTLIGGDMIL